MTAHRIASALAICAAIACTRVRVQDHPDGPIVRTATVTVENQNWADMTVYIPLSGGRIRLGVVPTFETATYVIPRGIALPSNLRFELVPFGLANGYVTEPIEVDRGERYALIVENAVEHTLLARRPQH